MQHATGAFNLNVDFEKVFNWNTNLIFVWVSATYKTGKKNVKNVFKIGNYISNSIR